MIPILTIIFFIFGLIIGSFLNVVVIRLNTERSFGGRSACMSCQNTLKWYELIPVFSFIGLLGRCRSCKTKISFQYPLVEFITGLIFTALFLKFQDIFFFNSITFVITYGYYAAVFCLLLVIAVYDLKHKIIPDVLSLILAVLSFIGLFIFSPDNYFIINLHLPSLWSFLAGPIIAAPFAFFWLVSGGRWMGLGDAKLAVGLGWFLGLAQALSGVVLAFWVGAVMGVLLLIFSGKYGMKSEIPFAPYLVLGASIAFLFSLSLFGSFVIF